MSHECCNDFTRAQLLRGAAAEAGKGLPAIEPGMPEPAGTGLSRRRFISRSAGLALAVYGASKIPLGAFERGIAEAAQGDKVLISIFFEGGIDAMSVLAPVGDPLYAGLRPNLKQAEGAGPTFTEDERLQWHPGAAALADLHGDGKVSVFPAIGYEHPDQSHFTSRHYYEIGELDIGQHAGWLGRYLDVVGDEENPLQGLSMDGSLSPMIATAEKPVAAIDSVDSYDMWSPVSAPISDEMYETFARFGSLPSDSPALLQVRRATKQTEQLREELGALGAFQSPVTYPKGEFAHKLAGLANYLEQRPAGAGGDAPRRGRLRHPLRPGRRPRQVPAGNVRRDRRLPEGPRSTRPPGPGDDRDVVASSAAGRRRTARRGPTTAPPAAPS